MTMTAGTATTPGSMAAGIYDKLNDTFGTVEYEGGDATRQEFCQAIAEAVIEHIQGHADVVVSGTASGLQRDSLTALTLASGTDTRLSSSVE